MFWLINSNQNEKKIDFECEKYYGKLRVTYDTYVNYIRVAEFEKYIQRQCEDLAIQHWHTMLQSTSFCDCCKVFKHRLLLKPYLQKLKGKQGVRVSQFGFAPYTSQRVTEIITVNHGQKCQFCCRQSKADEYHMIVVLNVLQIVGYNFFQILCKDYICNTR